MTQDMAVLLQDISTEQYRKCNDLFLFGTGPPSGGNCGMSGNAIYLKLPLSYSCRLSSSSTWLLNIACFERKIGNFP
jgi:hypothetical protein